MKIRSLSLLATYSLALIASSFHCVANEIDGALQARTDGLPQVAIAKLSDLLNSIPSGDPQKLPILRELGQTYLEAGRVDDALRILRDPALSSNPTARFWLAQALVAQGAFAQALAIYRELLVHPALKPYAALGVVRMLRALGKDGEALTALGDVPPNSPVAASAAMERVHILLTLGRVSDAAAILKWNPEAFTSSWGRYLLARVAMSEGRWSFAATVLDDIRPENNELASDLLLARSECSIQSGDLLSAESELAKFIQEHPQHPALPAAFTKLNEVYHRESDPSSADLRRWEEDADHSFRANYARFYYARNELRIHRTENAMGLFRKFIGDLPLHPLVNAARIEVARQSLSVGKNQDALDILSGFRPDLPGAQEIAGKVDFLRGSALFALGRHAAAAAAFLSAVRQDPSPQAETALYNAALASLLAGRSGAANPAQLELARYYPGGRAVRELHLMEALQKAREKRPDASKALDAIADISPRARLALAELRFAANDLKGASTQLDQLAGSNIAHSDRAAYLAIFLADNGDEEAGDRVIRLTREFLNSHPNSPFKPAVRMKLGEVFFRRGNFLGARIQFESLAREFPDSPLAEPALFFAGQSGARTMDPSAVENAMLVFEEVAKAGGSFALRARLEQAQLQDTAGHPDQALLILENILSSQPGADIRFETFMAKGNILFAQGTLHPENYAKAIEAWRKISSDPQVPAPWKNQALTKIGAAYQKTGNTDQALASYYDVFNKPNPADPEFFWFYKAGFDAGKLLESKQLWSEAINVYKRIASIAGPRSQEAKDRIERLRLENFIWSP